MRYFKEEKQKFHFYYNFYDSINDEEIVKEILIKKKTWQRDMSEVLKWIE